MVIRRILSLPIARIGGSEENPIQARRMLDQHCWLLQYHHCNLCTDYHGGPGINLCFQMSCYWYLTLEIHISAFWALAQWSTCQNLFCGRQPPETLNQLVQILTEILRNSFSFNWQVENPVGNTELAIFECGQWNIRPTIEAAARPRLRSDAPALLCRWSLRSFWINTRIFHLNGYCDSQQISNVRSSPRHSLKGYWPFFCMKGDKRGMAWKSEHTKEFLFLHFC